jgi:hypothetical protein
MQITRQPDNTFTWTGLTENRLLRLNRLLQENSRIIKENHGTSDNPITTDLRLCVEKAIWRETLL